MSGGRRVGALLGVLLASGCSALWAPWLGEPGDAAGSGPADLSDGARVLPAEPRVTCMDVAPAEPQFDTDGQACRPTLRGLWGDESSATVWFTGDSRTKAGACYQGTGTVLRRAKAQWTLQPADTANGMSLQAVWGVDEAALWAVGGFSSTQSEGAVVRHSGGSWLSDLRTAPSLPHLHDVRGIDGTSVFAVGERGAILSRESGAWDKLPGLDYDSVSYEYLNKLFTGVWPESADSVWVAGAELGAPSEGRATPAEPGVLVHLQRIGGRWSTQLYSANNAEAALKLPSVAVLNRVWGNGLGDVWAVGQGGTILHWNGKSWQKQQSPADRPLYGVRGRPGRAPWIVGDPDVLLRWDGSGWQRETVENNGTLLDLWQGAGGELWLIRFGGKVTYCAP